MGLLIPQSKFDSWRGLTENKTPTFMRGCFIYIHLCFGVANGNRTRNSGTTNRCDNRFTIATPQQT